MRPSVILIGAAIAALVVALMVFVRDESPQPTPPVSVEDPFSEPATGTLPAGEGASLPSSNSSGIAPQSTETITQGGSVNPVIDRWGVPEGSMRTLTEEEMATARAELEARRAAAGGSATPELGAGGNAMPQPGSPEASVGPGGSVADAPYDGPGPDPTGPDAQATWDLGEPPEASDTGVIGLPPEASDPGLPMEPPIATPAGDIGPGDLEEDIDAAPPEGSAEPDSSNP